MGEELKTLMSSAISEMIRIMSCELGIPFDGDDKNEADDFDFDFSIGKDSTKGFELKLVGVSEGVYFTIGFPDWKKYCCMCFSSIAMFIAMSMVEYRDGLEVRGTYYDEDDGGYVEISEINGTEVL